jgi:hypothetical protein
VAAPICAQVEAEFSPWELGLSEEAVHKLIQIVGPRYKPASKSVKIVAREASSSEHNRTRVLKQARLPSRLPIMHISQKIPMYMAKEAY